MWEKFSLLLTKAQWVSQSVSDGSKVGVLQSSVVFQVPSGVFEMEQLMNGREYLTLIYPSSPKKLACVSKKNNQRLKNNDIFKKLNKRSGKEKGKPCVLWVLNKIFHRLQAAHCPDMGSSSPAPGVQR